MDKTEEYIKKLKSFEPVESEDDYWEKHEVFKKALGGMYSNIKRLYGNPTKYTDQFEEILNEAIRIKLITEKFANKQRKKLYDSLNSKKLKQKVKNRIKKKKDYIKKFFKRKKEEK